MSKRLSRDMASDKYALFDTTAEKKEAKRLSVKRGTGTSGKR